jgi:Zn-dependent M28 family amino/carboxypeptidase
VRGSWTVEQFKLDRDQAQSLAVAGWVTHDAAAAALAAAGHDLAALTRAAARRDFRPVATGVRASVAVTSRVRRVPSENVVARLPGGDAGAAADAVLYTAHYDHKGIGVAVNGDSIYNGAEDNASGVAAMLEVARVLAAGPRARRSFLFAAVTAEESGLLGSEAWAADPPFPLARTAAVINLDGINVRGRTRDIGALGLDRSTLGPLFEAAAAAESLRVSREPDVRGSFFRSDHLPFAKAGVPALSLQDGVDFVGRPAEWGREQDAQYDRVRYHQPSDEWSAQFDYGGMLQVIRVVARTGLAVANAAELPRWLPTSEFQRPGAVAP